VSEAGAETDQAVLRLPTVDDREGWSQAPKARAARRKLDGRSACGKWT
jgi:hypothetical protein